MAGLVRSDTISLKQATAVGAQIAQFLADAPRRREGVDYRERIDRNFEMLLPLIESLIPARERLALQRFAAAFLIGWASVLEARASAGSVVEGHGDLRAENVLLGAEGVFIVGPMKAGGLSVVDVADELGSLVMELSGTVGARAARDAVFSGYVDAGGSPQPDALVAFFGTYRAQVRATFVLLEAGSGADARTGRERARRLLSLSTRLGWRARGPLLLVFVGPSEAAKSSLTRALGRTSGMAVLELDEDQAAEDGYADLARRARSERAVIVDAEFGDAGVQGAFERQLALDGGVEPLFVECRVPAAPGSAGGSAAMHGVAGHAHLTVDSRTPVSTQVDEVVSWLDSLMASGGNFEASNPQLEGANR